MSSTAAAVSALPRPPRLHPSPGASASPFRRHRRLRCLTKVYAVVSRDHKVSVPVSAICPANKNESIFKLTLDLSQDTDLFESYKTPGQAVQISVAWPEPSPAWMEIASAPHSGAHQFDFLVRSVPGTTAERLCKLKEKDYVELIGSVTGPGFPTHVINQAENVLYLAVAEGLSPIRALIQSGLTKNVILYYGARNEESVPLKEELDVWKTIVHVEPVALTEPVQYPFLRDPAKIIKNPNSTVAVLVGPMEMQQEVKRALRGTGVPPEKNLHGPGVVSQLLNLLSGSSALCWAIRITKE